MSQPVKLSDSLILDARLTGEIAERSIAGQIEFWAGLGRAIEPLLRGVEALALRKSGSKKSIAQILAEVDTKKGRQRMTDFLEAAPFPHYQPAESAPGYLLRIEENGTRSVGRFVNRRFEVLADSVAH